MQTMNLLHDALGLEPGNYTVESIALDDWGQRVLLACVYRHPPQPEKSFTLIFEGCSTIQWHLPSEPVPANDRPAQLMTHDLGEANYRRTARFLTTRVEVILSYRQLKIERT